MISLAFFFCLHGITGAPKLSVLAVKGLPYTPPITVTNGTPVWKPENSSMPTL